MHIGLYFGSFNPIHIGHMIVANHVQQHTEIDKLWFVPSPHNPLKDSHALLNEYDRMHLVELAIADNLKFRASRVEFQLPKPSFTIDTLTYLSERFPLERFSVILGSDSLMNLKRWKNWQKLVELYPLIVYKRPGFPVEIPAGAKVQVVEAPLLDISASFIRTEIRAKRSVQYLLPDPVWKYVIENRYYL